MARGYQGVIRRRWHRRVGVVVQELVELLDGVGRGHVHEVCHEGAQDGMPAPVGHAMFLDSLR
jgi:hypothetical protein